MKYIGCMEQALQALIRFRDERDWAQFHDSRNLALALSIEAAELNELFLWKKDGDLPDLQRLKEELADILAYALLLAHNHQLDLESIVLEKIELNARKYPVDKSKGRAEKYDLLQ